MKKRYMLTAFILAGLQLCAADKEGYVNLNQCIIESKLGKQEQASFETMRKQFATLLEDTEKQLKEINDKLSDKDFLDGLSPDAEQELKNKFAQLGEEYNRYQQQYYQVMNQGQQKLLQNIVMNVSKASEKIATTKGYTKIAHKDSCFYVSPSLDITNDVIKEMDKSYDEEMKKQSAPAAAASAPTAAKEEPKQVAVAPKEETKAAAPKEEAKKPAAPEKVLEKAPAKAAEKQNAKDAPKPR
jgi:outer membrane protein